jgi:Cation transporter/ATPase, N-terminus
VTDVHASTCGNFTFVHASTRAQRNELAVDLKKRLEYEHELKNFHRCSTEALAVTLATSETQGLAADTAAGRLARDGPNIIQHVRSRPMWARFLLCFVSGFSPLLWVATGFVFLSWRPFGKHHHSSEMHFRVLNAGEAVMQPLSFHYTNLLTCTYLQCYVSRRNSTYGCIQLVSSHCTPDSNNSVKPLHLLSGRCSSMQLLFMLLCMLYHASRASHIHRIMIVTCMRG